MLMCLIRCTQWRHCLGHMRLVWKQGNESFKVTIKWTPFSFLAGKTSRLLSRIFNALWMCFSVQTWGINRGLLRYLVFGNTTNEVSGLPFSFLPLTSQANMHKFYSNSRPYSKLWLADFLWLLFIYVEPSPLGWTFFEWALNNVGQSTFQNWQGSPVHRKYSFYFILKVKTLAIQKLNWIS